MGTKYNNFTYWCKVCNVIFGQEDNNVVKSLHLKTEGHLRVLSGHPPHGIPELFRKITASESLVPKFDNTKKLFCVICNTDVDAQKTKVERHCEG